MQKYTTEFYDGLWLNKLYRINQTVFDFAVINSNFKAFTKYSFSCYTNIVIGKDSIITKKQAYKIVLLQEIVDIHFWYFTQQMTKKILEAICF